MPQTIFTGHTDAEAVNNSDKGTTFYRDLNLYFNKNPVTGDISAVTDVQDIKRAVRNIILLNTWDKPFHPELGPNVRGALFENYDIPTITDVAAKITRTVNKYEPRVRIIEVLIPEPELQVDSNTLRIFISFFLKSAPNIAEELELILKRAR
ncbi:MAG: hypothetical protein CMI58_01535 [Parcubacteria group bacterium]|jgi:phage baseplate assembly protein W|nr:hypothetical protein [Parcubacteria group bacterium]MDP7367059.1 GPW/gp25 family protein [Candidatus Paceibacterota bacterium]